VSATETALSETLSTRAVRRQRKMRAEAVRASERAERRRAKKALDEVAREALDEKIAPSIQRLGTGTKNPRLVRDGITFRVASPLRYMVAKGKRREANGGQATINKAHEHAAERLMRAWDVCQSISVATSKYGDAVSGTVQSGILSDAVIASVTRQRDAMAEVNGARLALGPLWPPVEAVALKGQNCKDWAASLKKPMEEAAAVGFLRAGLDVLIEFYRARNRRPLDERGKSEFVDALNEAIDKRNARR
jgi:hypothetical protein